MTSLAPYPCIRETPSITIFDTRSTRQPELAARLECALWTISLTFHIHHIFTQPVALGVLLYRSHGRPVAVNRLVNLQSVVVACSPKCGPADLSQLVE